MKMVFRIRNIVFLNILKVFFFGGFFLFSFLHLSRKGSMLNISSGLYVTIVFTFSCHRYYFWGKWAKN